MTEQLEGDLTSMVYLKGLPGESHFCLKITWEQTEVDKTASV